MPPRVATSVSANEAAAVAAIDAATWRKLHNAETNEIFAAAWLALQCAQLQAVRSGCVVLGAPDEGPYLPIAFWPDAQRGSAAVLSSAELAIHERRGVLRDPGDARPEAQRAALGCLIAVPIIVDQRVHGAVAIELRRRPEAELADALRLLQWGCAWFEARLRRDSGRRFDPGNHRLSWLLELVAAAVEPEHYTSAASAFVTQLATRLGCERVSLGWRRGQRIEVDAFSHSARFAERSELLDSVGALMNEAADQARTLVVPAPQGSVQGVWAHEHYAGHHAGCALCTVVLVRSGEVAGALSFERPAQRPFDAATIEFCEAAGALLGPLLDLRRRADLPWTGRLGAALARARRQLLAPGLNPAKVASGLVCVALALAALAKGPYRISADTQIEGLVQRVVAAPVNGYVQQAFVRAGDLVRRGDVLAQLDDRDLRLERAKWTSQRGQHEQEYRDALARGSRAEVEVLRAEVGAAAAELALVEERLARSRIVSPLDGVVVSGDLDHSLGAPVTQGDVLFKVAPLQAWRVVLEVDERDMEGVVPGVPGRLVLAGRADTVLPLHVDKVTPVAEAHEGRNLFRVEARLDNTPDFLRPGMRGVGKLDLGERRYAWIWTHSLLDWLRLALWGWLP